MRALHPVPPGQEKDVARGVADLRATSAPSIRTGKADGDSSTNLADELHDELAHYTAEYLMEERDRLALRLTARGLIRSDA